MAITTQRHEIYVPNPNSSGDYILINPEVQVTAVTPITNEDYYSLLHSANSGNLDPLASNAVRWRINTATGSAIARLALGVGGNAPIPAQLYLYSGGTKAHIVNPTSTDTEYTHALPNSSGWLVSAASAGVGTSSAPVYISSDGVATKGSTYAGGTAVTLNGTSKAASTASFYAPTAAGTKTTQALISGGANAAPTWTNISPSVTWTAGTTAGPTLKVSALGQTSSAVAVPSASETASGIITTDLQHFSGVKTFPGLGLRFSNHTKGTAPATQEWRSLEWFDDKGTNYITNRYAKIETAISTTNETTMAIAVADPGNNTAQVEGGLYMVYPAGGAPYANFRTAYLGLLNNSNRQRGVKLDASLDGSKTYGVVRTYYNDVERTTLYSNSEGGNLKLIGPDGDYIELDHFGASEDTHPNMRIVGFNTSGTHTGTITWTTDVDMVISKAGLALQDSSSLVGRIIRISNSYGDIALHAGTSGRGIWDYTKGNWFILRNKDDGPNGLNLQDGSKNAYGGIWDNGTSLWIGATGSTTRQHKGQTYISTGYSGSAGYSTVKCFVPSSYTSGTEYPMWHEHNSLRDPVYYYGSTSIPAPTTSAPSTAVKTFKLNKGRWLITASAWSTSYDDWGFGVYVKGTYPAQYPFKGYGKQGASGACIVTITANNTDVRLEVGHGMTTARTGNWCISAIMLRADAATGVIPY